MKHTLSENIGCLRREWGMTQEQLAEAMGVSFAAVSKWERGVSAPELGTMLELADLFEVSLDALVGYTVQDNDQQTVIERLQRYQHDRETRTSMRMWKNPCNAIPTALVWCITVPGSTG